MSKNAAACMLQKAAGFMCLALCYCASCLLKYGRRRL